MRVAIGWNWPSRLADCSFRFERYVAGFRELGHAPFLVCARSALEGFEPEVDSFPCEELRELREASFWRRAGADLVVLVTWHAMTGELDGIRASGARVAAFADTDGRVPWA